MKRPLVIAVVAELLGVAAVLHSAIKDFLFLHPWLLSTLCALPALVLAFAEATHSRKANRLQEEANDLQRRLITVQENADKFYEQANNYREDANKHREEANRYREEANKERARANKALGRIADHTKREPTKAERTAERLRKHLRAKVQVVNADDSSWGTPAEIVEIKDDVVTLFSPAGFSSSAANAVQVHCDNLEITERSGGSLMLKILKRHGTTEHLGEIKSWEQRGKPPTAPLIKKGPNVFHADYSKPASSERKRLFVFEAADGSNSYMLEGSDGQTFYGNNAEISRQFMLTQLEIETQGFRYSGGGTGGAHHELFIRTRT
jgi:hypothetical protein